MAKLNCWPSVLGKRVAPFVFLVGIAEGGACLAQQQLSHLSMEQLGNIEVTTVTKQPKEISRTPAAIYVLTSEDIRRSGATNVAALLRLVPGVEVGQIDSSTWAVGIRGFGSIYSRSVLVLIDGRSVYTPLNAGVNWRLQNVLLEDVERVEVIRGPGGTIWGSNAVNGVINIITRNSRDTHGAFALGGGGNVDQGMAGFRYGAAAGQNFNYRAYGMAFGRSPEFHTDRDNFDDWQLGQVGFRMDWADQKRDSFALEGDLYQGRSGEKRTVSYFSPPASADVEAIEHVSGGNLLGRWSHSLSSGSDIQIQAYYDRTRFAGTQGKDTRNTFDIDFIHHFTLLERQDITWGIGARWSPSDFVQVIPTLDFLPSRRSNNIYSAFVQDEVALIPGKLSITPGSKFEHNIYTGWEIQPGARLLYTPTSHQMLWAAATRAVRTPSRFDVDLQFSETAQTTPLPVFVTLTGNPKFVSETLAGYEAGYRTLLSRSFAFDVAAFYNRYNHLSSLEQGVLSLEASPPPLHAIFPVVFGNGLKGTTHGFEIAPDWKPTPWWRLEGSYSYLQMHLKTRQGSMDTTSVNSATGSSPRHQVVAESFFDLPRNVDFSLALRYVSALPAQGSPTSTGSMRVQGYETADARLAWRPGRRVEFSVTGQNLTQPHHFEFGGDPGPLIGIRRAIYGALVFRR